MLTAARVRDLATHTGDPAVASMYLDVDGSHRPVWRDCVSAFDHLAGLLHEQAELRGDRTVSRAVDEDVARMRAWLDAGVDRDRTRGVALFSCSGQGFFEAVEVPTPVRDEAAIGPAPRIGPLLALLDGRRRSLVALVDRRRLRLLRMELGEVTELPAAEDTEPRAVDTTVELGSFERYTDEAAEAHYRRAAGLVDRQVRDWPPDHLLLGGPDEAVAGLVRHLPAAVADMVAGRLRVGAAVPVSEIAAAAGAAEAAVERDRRAAAVDQLLGRAGADTGGSLGLEATLGALAEGRVGTLLVSDGFGAPGVACPSCGSLGTGGGTCPSCGTDRRAVDDVVEAAVASAVAAGATVVVCQPGELDAAGGIGAVGRW